MSTLVRGVCFLVVLATLLVGTPSAQAGAGDGRRLLIGANSLVDGSGTLKSVIPVATDAGARFSTDGTVLAHPRTEDCSAAQDCDFRGYLVLQNADGTKGRTAAIPWFDIESVAWDPDGNRLAVLGRTFEPGLGNEARVYLLPADGSAATRVFDDTLTVRMFVFGGISWRSTNDTLAVVATEFFETEDGGYAAYGLRTDLIWTMPAEFDATPSRYSGESEPCADICWGSTGYRWPSWSPDGSRLAVLDTDQDDGNDSWVGDHARGASSATRLAAAQLDRPIGWSADGEELAFSIPDVDEDFYADTRVIDADTKATLATITGTADQFVDRLPCPGGTCPVWQNVYVPPRAFMNLQGRARPGKVLASGTMGNVPDETTVAVTLFKKARSGAPWRKVTTAGQVRVVEGMFSKSFDRPRAVQCKVTGVWTDGARRATDADSFSC